MLIWLILGHDTIDNCDMDGAEFSTFPDLILQRMRNPGQGTNIYNPIDTNPFQCWDFIEYSSFNCIELIISIKLLLNDYICFFLHLFINYEKQKSFFYTFKKEILMFLLLLYLCFKLVIWQNRITSTTLYPTLSSELNLMLSTHSIKTNFLSWHTLWKENMTLS